MYRLCMAVLTAAGLLIADQASANIVNSGVDTTVSRFIFREGSTVTYHPSSLIVVGYPSDQIPPEPETRNISGSFDGEFLRYWWEDTRLVVYPETNPLALTEQYWLRLANPEVAGVEDWADFMLFSPALLMSTEADYSDLHGRSGA